VKHHAAYEPFNEVYGSLRDNEHGAAATILTRTPRTRAGFPQIRTRPLRVAAGQSGHVRVQMQP
jgi:hypothetical protein